MSTTRYVTRRRLLEGTAALGAATLILPGKAPAQGGAKPLQGVTLNVSTFSAPFPKLLKELLPEFEAATGAKVNFDTPSFPVYNQRADLELSTGGSAYDVVNVTFIYSSRWIDAGWLTPLDDYIRDPNRTPADWDVEDFLPGARAPETGKDGKLYGIPWTVDTYIAGAVALRPDHRPPASTSPTRTDDLVKVLQAVHRKEGVAGFVTDNHYGWTFVPYLQAFGGDVFRNPPDDLTPMLDTPEAVGGRRVLRQPAARVRPRRRAVLHQRPGVAGAEGRAASTTRPTARPTSGAGRRRRPPARRPKTVGLRPGAQGPGRALPRRRRARPRHPGRLAQQGCRLGLHPVGAVQADHAQGAGREGLQLADAALATSNRPSSSSG